MPTARMVQSANIENVSSTLNGAVTNVATTITINDASNFLSPSYAVIDRVDASGTLKATSAWEYVYISGISSNDLTVTRGVGGSTAQAHSTGAVIETIVTASAWSDLRASYLTQHSTGGNHDFTASAVTIATLYVTGNINASGASSVGIGGGDPLTQKNITVTSIASVAQLNIGTLINASGASIVGFTGGFNALFHIPGGIASQANIGGLIPVPAAYTGQFIAAYVQTPASLSSIGIFIMKNQAVYGTVQILAGNTYASSASIGTAALISTDVLTLDIKSNASLAQDLSVILRAI